MQVDYTAGTVTPEAVKLNADVAGIGSRSIALIVDTFIQGLLLLPVFLLPFGSQLDGGMETVVLILILFLVLWLYYPAFEFAWRGQTPGKRFQGIRVVRTNGQPAGLAPILVRNLIRIVDVMTLPFLAVISMFITRRSQRLGDLAAGTMVVHDRKLKAPTILDLRASGDPVLLTLDTSGLNERDYTVMRTFLERRHGLDMKARQELAHRLATRIRERAGEPAGTAGGPAFTDEQVIEAAAQSYRARFGERTR
jgi:uncharacterized RDD family membrane protein YckC